MDVRIRGVSEQDYSALCLLEQGSSESSSSYQAAVFIRQAMVLWPRTFLIAEKNGEFSGYYIGSLVPDAPLTGWVLRLKVCEGMRRQGLATRLLIQGEEVMHRDGAEQMFLSCSPVNHGALALYERLSYRVIRHEASYFGQGEDRYILSKEL
jgi:ribosomal protein S18 acetylase RimI-like enzyme